MATSNPDRDFVVITITWENYITKNNSLSTHSVSWNSDECEKISYTGEFGNFSVDRLQSQVCPGMDLDYNCLLYTSPSPRDRQKSRMPSSA